MCQRSISERVEAVYPPLCLEFYQHQGQVLGVDLGAHLDHPTGSRALCEVAFQLATEHQLTIFDPQLGQLVTEAEAELIHQHYEQSVAFSQCSPLCPPAHIQSGRLSPSLRLWLAVIGILALVLLLSRAINW